MAEGGGRLRMLLAFPGLIVLAYAVETFLLRPEGDPLPPEAAVAYWEGHAQRNPRSAASQVRLALAYEGVRDWEAAQRAYAAALTVAPGFEDAAVGRAGVLRRTGRRAASIEALERFALANPGCVVCFQNLAAEYLDLGRLAEAEGAVEKLLAGDLTVDTSVYDATDLHVEAYLLAGRVYAARGDHERALALLRKATARAPADPRGHLFQARSLVATGRAPDARAALERAEARLGEGSRDARWRREIAELRRSS